MNLGLKITPLLLFIALQFCALAQQIEATTVTCLEVQADGSVGVTWTEIPDQNGLFLQYQVGWHDVNTQNSTIFLTEPDITSTYFLDSSVDANAGPVCYEITVAPTAGPASSSNILCTIFLNATIQTNPAIVDFSWNDPVPSYSTIPAGSIYKLMEEYPVGDWHEIASFAYEPDLTTFPDYEFTICNDFANYRLDLCLPNATCTSKSNVVTLLAQDDNQPDALTITGLSVDTISGLPILDWNSGSDPDIAGYTVYWCTGNGFPQPIDVPGANNTEAEINVPLNFLEQSNFLVAAYDFCGNPGTTGDISVENCDESDFEIIYLTSQWATCQDHVQLNWNEYDGWGYDGIAFYEVRRKTNNQGSEVIGVLSDGETSFIDFDIQPGNTYEYFIWAYSATVNGGECISNIALETIIAPPEPAIFSIFTATVDAENEHSILVNTALTSTIFDYVLLRKSDKDPFYQEVANISTNTPPVEFPDLDVNSAAFYYDYQIGLVNQCNDTVRYSNLGRTIKVSGIANSETLINTITWNEYVDWENGVDSYEIYRSVDGGAPELLAINQPGVLYYEDDVSDQLESKGQFCYFIVAQEGNNTLGIPAQSVSNVLCLAQPPKIWIPNAIAINGINDEFFPTISFADRDTYRMVIFNRWGQELFITYDTEDSWDGTKKGNLVQEGTYTYYIEIADGSGQIYEYRGPVTLLMMNAN